MLYFFLSQHSWRLHITSLCQPFSTIFGIPFPTEGQNTVQKVLRSSKRTSLAVRRVAYAIFEHSDFQALFGCIFCTSTESFFPA